MPTQTIQNLHKNKSWYGNIEQELRHSCHWQTKSGQVKILSATHPLSNLPYDHHALVSHQGSGRTESSRLQQAAIPFRTMFIAGMIPCIDTDLSKS